MEGTDPVEHDAFDELARLVTQERGSRRAVVRLVTGGALASLSARFALGEEASAKKKRGKGRCYGSLPVYCSPTAEDPNATCYPRGAQCCGKAKGGGACPPGRDCCPPNPRYPTGSCAPTGKHCCPASAGGGYCADVTPVCCAPTLQDPFGLCIPSGFRCCTTAQGGGYCRDDQTCCPPSPGFPNGTCAGAGFACPPTFGVAVASHHHEPRQMEPPRGSVVRGGEPRLD
jgi:hypothetical protein